MSNNLFKNFKVSETNLLPFLSPTSKGTNWYDSPPEGKVYDRNVGRVALQIHQLVSIISNYKKVDESQDNFIDIGTGNGLVPDFISRILPFKNVIGIDPFEDGEHETSWQKNTREELLVKVIKIFQDENKFDLSFQKYKKLIQYEKFANIPRDQIFDIKKKKWKFNKIDSNSLDKLNLKFSCFYAKAIDHIPNWELLFQNINKVASLDAILVIKHNSFFSYLGAHRYSSTFIPWGHVCMSEKEYEQYVKLFHKDRVEKMLDFYYNGLSYPRYSISQLNKILLNLGWQPIWINYEQDKDILKKVELAGGISKLYDDISRNFQDISIDEILSGRIHLVFKKKN
ncbi:hypothetical protein OBA40_07425 [Alphaproteobacteria bacterium]|nr:hypothetical protein [Alphaproteobacteria bacterium]